MGCCSSGEKKGGQNAGQKAEPQRRPMVLDRRRSEPVLQQPSAAATAAMTVGAGSLGKDSPQGGTGRLNSSGTLGVRRASSMRGLPRAPSMFFSHSEPEQRSMPKHIVGRQEAAEPCFSDGAPFVDMTLTVRDAVLDPPLEFDARRSGPAEDTTSSPKAQIRLLGIDTQKEPRLLLLARMLASAKLPIGWAVVDGKAGEKVYHKVGSQQGQVEHPLTAHFAHLLHESRRGINGNERANTLDGRGVLSASTLGLGIGLRCYDGAAVSKDSVDYNDMWQRLWEVRALQTGQIKEREEALQEVLDDFHAAAVDAVTVFADKLAAGGAESGRDGNLLLTLLNGGEAKRKYGSATIAAKLASREMQMMHRVLESNLPQLCVPVHCIVRYLGLHVLVTATLPTSESTSLVALGPDTHAKPASRRKSVARTDPESLLRIVASDLRLKPHRDSVGSVVPSDASATVQLRFGADRRLYITRCGGMLPRLPFMQVDVFRSELVRDFRAQQADAEFFNSSEDRVLTDLSDFLTKTRVPEFARRFLTDPAILDGASLTDAMHCAGINMRQLGRLLRIVEKTAPPGSASRVAIIKAEIVARAVKQQIRTLPSINTFFSRIIDDMNALLPAVRTKFPGFDETDLNKWGVQDMMITRLGELLHSRVDRALDGAAVLVELNKNAVHKRSRVRHRPVVFAWQRGYHHLRPEILHQLDRKDLRARLNADSLTPEAHAEDLVTDMRSLDTVFRVNLFDPERTQEGGVPVFASHILNEPPSSGAELTREMHGNGINMRFLGSVLDFCMEWQHDGKWSTVLNPGTQTPMAVELLLSEMLARSFRRFLDEQIAGLTYTAGTAAAKAAFQKLLSEPSFLVARARRDFGGPLKFEMPPADQLLGRAAELCGATVEMLTPDVVGEVMLTPTVKRMKLPASMCVAQFVSDDPLSRAEMAKLTDAERVISDRAFSAERAQRSGAALCDLGLLSVLFERWEVTAPGSKQRALQEVRQQMMEAAAPGTAEAGDVNMMMGDFWDGEDEADAAREYYLKAVQAYEDAGQECVSNLVSALQSLGDAEQVLDEPENAGAYYSRARSLLDKQTDPERCATLEKLVADAFLAEQDARKDGGRNLDAAVVMYRRAVATAERAGRRSMVLADALSALARLYYRMEEYDKATDGWKNAVSIMRKVSHGGQVPVADDLLNLGQVEMVVGMQAQRQGDVPYAMHKLDNAAEHFGNALKIYDQELVGSERVEKCQMVLVRYLARVQEQRGRNSDAVKCQLFALEYQMGDDHPDVANKLFEVACTLAQEATENPQQRSEALRWFRRAMASCEEVFVDDDTKMNKCADWIARLEELERSDAQSGSQFGEARTVQKTGSGRLPADGLKSSGSRGALVSPGPRLPTRMGSYSRKGSKKDGMMSLAITDRDDWTGDASFVSS